MMVPLPLPLPPPGPVAPRSIGAFHERLLRSRRVLALCGAGLSAASGLPTFRGAGGLWRGRLAAALATPEAFARDPGLVWLFYAHRRHAALRARPNLGHFALAALARRMGVGFLCLSQNVDNLHLRAGHPPEHLRLLHGSLFDLKCARAPRCDWTQRNNLADPLCAALALASSSPSSSSSSQEDAATRFSGQVPAAPPDDASSRELAHIPVPSELPRCPRCGDGLQRPGVVWFGEELDAAMLDDVARWIGEAAVDMVLMVGTSGVVYPAAGFVDLARSAAAAAGGEGGGGSGGTSVVTVNLDADAPASLGGMRAGDFAFAGNAAELLPALLEPLIGRPRENGQYDSDC